MGTRSHTSLYPHQHPDLATANLALTNGMRANRVGVHTKERDGDERAIAAKTQDSVAQLERSLMLIRIALVEIDVCGRLA